MIDLELGGKQYSKICLSILPCLCADLLLGLDFQRQHRSVIFHHGGPQPPLEVCGLSMLKVGPPELFANLTADCHSIATKSRRYSHDDRKFIDAEDRCLLKEGIIESSNSPWLVQVVVTRNENHKKRLIIDAYPLPRIEDTVDSIAQYRVFSTIDLCCAYHQVKINNSDKPYTAFQAGNALYQFTRVPFGVANGVACFHMAMDSIITEEQLQATFPYLDNITICGKDQREHDVNLKHFLEAAS